MNPAARMLAEALAAHTAVLTLHDRDGATRRVVGWLGSGGSAVLPAAWHEDLHRGWVALLWLDGLPVTTFSA